MHQHLSKEQRPPIVVLSQEAKQESMARALLGEKNEFSYQLNYTLSQTEMPMAVTNNRSGAVRSN